MKALVLVLFFLVGHAAPPTYIIVVGDITCKSCATDLAKHLHKKAGNSHYSILIKNTGNMIANELRISYFKSELPHTAFKVSSDSTLFPKDAKYPYVLKVSGTDTLHLSYDELFRGINLNAKALR